MSKIFGSGDGLRKRIKKKKTLNGHLSLEIVNLI
jgi:hypothetical protein